MLKGSTKTLLLYLAFTAIISLLGQQWGGRQGLLYAFTFSLSIIVLIHISSESFVLKRLKCRPLEGQDPDGLIGTTSRIAEKARVPTPQFFVLESEAPQALALGRGLGSSAILMSEGLIRRFSAPEREAVIAYLIATIRRRDTLLLSTLAVALSCILRLASSMDQVVRTALGSRKSEFSFESNPFTFLLCPFLSAFLKSAVTVKTYYATDSLAASYLEDSRNLAGVLWKMESLAQTQPLQVPPGLAHLFIVNPLTTRGWYRYFRSQPAAENRIRKLVGYYPI